MSGYWKLNGVELYGVDFTVIFDKLTQQQRARQSKTDIHQGKQAREFHGLDLPTGTITVKFNKRGTAKFDEMAYIQGILETDEVWTLEAPSDKPVFVYKNFKRAALAFEAWNHDALKATGSVGLAFDFIVDGAWIADGGTYCENVHGSFTFLNPTYVRDDSVNTGTVPTIELPEQTLGYPLFTNTSYGRSIPTAISTRVDTYGRVYKTYSLAGFLVPAPTTAGDVGVYDGCSSPSSAFLGIGVMPPCGTVSASLLTGDVPFGEYLSAYTTESFNKATGPVYANSSARSESFKAGQGVAFSNTSTRSESFVEDDGTVVSESTTRTETLTVTNS